MGTAINSNRCMHMHTHGYECTQKQGYTCTNTNKCAHIYLLSASTLLSICSLSAYSWSVRSFALEREVLRSRVSATKVDFSLTI